MSGARLRWTGQLRREVRRYPPAWGAALQSCGSASLPPAACGPADPACGPDARGWPAGSAGAPGRRPRWPTGWHRSGHTTLAWPSGATRTLAYPRQGPAPLRRCGPTSRGRAPSQPSTAALVPSATTPAADRAPGVMAREVVDAADGWAAAEGGVGSVMVVPMDPGLQGVITGGVGAVQPLVRPLLGRGAVEPLHLAVRLGRYGRVRRCRRPRSASAVRNTRLR
jgi:hypothetical protein